MECTLDQIGGIRVQNTSVLCKAVFHYFSKLAGNVSTIFTEVQTKCFHLDKNQTVVCYNHNRNHFNPKACFF